MDLIGGRHFYIDQSGGANFAAGLLDEFLPRSFTAGGLSNVVLLNHTLIF